MSHSAAETVDPVVALLISGAAATVGAAEEMVLDASLDRTVELVASDLDDAAFRRHPLIALLLSRGSRGWEDALT